MKDLPTKQKVDSNLIVADTTEEGKTTFEVALKTYAEKTT